MSGRVVKVSSRGVAREPERTIYNHRVYDQVLDEPELRDYIRFAGPRFVPVLTLLGVPDDEEAGRCMLCAEVQGLLSRSWRTQETRNGLFARSNVRFRCAGCGLRTDWRWVVRAFPFPFKTDGFVRRVPVRWRGYAR